MGQEPGVMHDPAHADALLDAVSHGIGVLDADGVIVHCNQAASTMLGLDKEQIVGRSLYDPTWDAVHGDGSPFDTVDHPAFVALQTGRPSNDTVIGVRRTDSSIIWLGMDAEPLTDPATGAVHRVVLTFVDIGRRRALERALRTLSRGNSVLFHSTDEATMLRDMCQTIIDSGQYALAWVGVGETDPQRSVRIVASAGTNEYLYEGMITWSDDDPRGLGPTGIALRTGEIQLAADLVVQRDYDPWRQRAQEHGFGSSLVIPMMFPFGVRAALSIYAPDARAFDQASVALLGELAADLAYGIDQLRIRALHRVSSDASPLCKIVLDPAGGIAEHNPAAQRLVGAPTGANTDEAVATAFGPVLAELLPGSVRMDPASSAWTALRMGCDTEVRSADGTAHPIRIWAAPIVDGTGEVMGTMVAGQDLTEIRVLEAQIRHAERMESVGALAGGVAHEFNNLLAVILMTTEVQLTRDDLEPAVRTAFENVMHSGQMAASLTRQLLALSRRQAMAPVDTDLNVVVADACTMLHPLLGADITLVTDFAEQPLPVRVDRGQIEQVLINFAVNARHAMSGAGTLTVRTSADVPGDPSAPESRFVSFSVSDTGGGIPEEIRDRIFEPFFTTKDVGVGTGLGLATADGIVRQSGGRILIDSTIGVGSTFTVVLPSAPTDD